MASIADFLSNIGLGGGQDQLGLADILNAVGTTVGPVLANRGGYIGMPLGLGLSAVGQLGSTLADKVGVDPARVDRLASTLRVARKRHVKQAAHRRVLFGRTDLVSYLLTCLVGRFSKLLESRDRRCDGFEAGLKWSFNGIPDL